MEIPVSGYTYHSNDSAPVHSHPLYVNSWDGRLISLHVHSFSGATSYNAGHNHRFIGITEPVLNTSQHTHRYFAFTSFNDGHRHMIRGVTGPAIPLSEGGHYHKFEGVTNIEGITPHRHRYSGRTSS